MFRFQASKFKNATGKVPKKEVWIQDVGPVVPSPSFGRRLAASRHQVAVVRQSTGSSTITVCPLDATAAEEQENFTLPQSGLISDIQFSPFGSSCLATSSNQGVVKIWQLENKQAAASLQESANKIDMLEFHPAASGILATACNDHVSVWDVELEQVQIELTDEYQGQIQGQTWCKGGQLLATSSKDKTIRLFDPRASTTPIQKAEAHGNAKDSKIIWLQDSNYILTSGFDRMSERQIRVYDMRIDFTCAANSWSTDAGPSVLLPLYDSDTGMLFLVSRGESSIHFWEFNENKNGDNMLLAMSTVVSDHQSLGACLVPKLSMDVMQCEVNRLLQLTKDAVIPIPFRVPRKSYRNFHADLYPDTYSDVAAMTHKQWLAGENFKVQKRSLDPNHSEKPPPQPQNGMEAVAVNGVESVQEAVNGNAEVQQAEKTEVRMSVEETIGDSAEDVDSREADKNISEAKAEGEESTAASKEDSEESVRDDEPKVSEISIKETQQEDGKPVLSEKPKRPAKPRVTTALKEEKPKPEPAFKNVAGNRNSGLPANLKRISKCRHVKGTQGHKNTQFENIRNLSSILPMECNGFQTNAERCAFVLGGPGGKMVVLELSNPGRLPDADIPVLVNSTNVTDFVWDPFNNDKLFVGCDDGNINIWQIPAEGLTASQEKPSISLQVSVSGRKVVSLVFHPLASDILAVACQDGSLNVWDMNKQKSIIELDNDEQSALSVSWSANGRFLAAMGKDGKIRIFEPRNSESPVQVFSWQAGGKRAARLIWVCDDNYIAISGFSRSSLRILALYNVAGGDGDGDDRKPIASVDLDVSPSLLLPFYDADTGTIFLAGKGDSTIYCFEVSLDPPHIFQLSNYKASGLHQSLAFLPKKLVDVKIVEFARCLRLTNNYIAPVSFTVPRVKMEFFQSDLFPDTKVTWAPSVTGEEWCDGTDVSAAVISLKPDGMPAMPSQMTESKRASAPVKQSQRMAPAGVQLRQQPPATAAAAAEKEPLGAKKASEKIQSSMSKRMTDLFENFEKPASDNHDEWES